MIYIKIFAFIIILIFFVILLSRFKIYSKNEFIKDISVIKKTYCIINLIKKKKINQINNFSKKLILSSLRLFFFLTFIFVYFFFILIFDQDIKNLLLNLNHAIIISIIFIFFAFLTKKNNYNFYDKILHYIFLKFDLVKKINFDLEKFFFKKKIINLKKNQHIFICSLPRSGTTLMLETFYKTNKFGSLQYSDMPFISAPNLFSQIKNQKNFKKKKRFHEDAIKFDLNSPEAFDEVMFRLFEKEKSYKNFISYVNLILYKKKKIILS